MVSEFVVEVGAGPSPGVFQTRVVSSAAGGEPTGMMRLGVDDINGRPTPLTAHHTIEITRKGRKPGYVIAPASLLDETDGYISGLRFAWLKRARRRGRAAHHPALFVNARGAPVSKNAYQRAVSRAGLACGFKATTHLLRATFACMLLARLE
ncbi:MAG TPA: site-specific integrase, partial [Propionicimonas sp.]|nr:site-specific integrase [Propionicimonas sp.]